MITLQGLSDSCEHRPLNAGNSVSSFNPGTGRSPDDWLVVYFASVTQLRLRVRAGPSSIRETPKEMDANHPMKMKEAERLAELSSVGVNGDTGERMSKPGKKKAKNQARRANSKFASHNISMLDHHQESRSHRRATAQDGDVFMGRSPHA